MLKRIGPGVLIAAAFIGPGTVTVCTLAGVNFGFALLWCMVLSILATAVFQEMAARLGLINRKGLATLLKEQLTTPLIRNLVIALILSAIVIGNAAYEAGNIGGASLGLEAIFGMGYNQYYHWLTGSLVFLLLFQGSYRLLEQLFVTLVTLMSLSFLLTAILTRPALSEIFQNLFVPDLPDGSLLTALALIGTTVVPYNLFLHASLVKEKWHVETDLKYARSDTYLSVFLGGIVSMAIIIAAAVIDQRQIASALDLALALEPLYGEAARFFLGLGLFAAGITSSVTAPLAASYVACNCFGWENNMKDWRFRMVWMVVLFFGLFSQTLGYNPIEIITFAQVTNGLLLPVVAILVIWLANNSKILGHYRNTIWQNLIGSLLIILIVLLGLKSILTAF